MIVDVLRIFFHCAFRFHRLATVAVDNTASLYFCADCRPDLLGADWETTDGQR